MSGRQQRLLALVPALAGRSIVVVGDVILDEYLVGRPSRLSREAPVPVLEFSRRFFRPGGAANPAVNIQALGSRARLVSVRGDDQPGETLARELEGAGLSTDGLEVRAGARTALKSRLLAESSSSRQHVARIDYPASRGNEASRQALEARLRAAARDADALLISDYKGGIVEPGLIELVRGIGRERGIIAVVDSQGDLALFGGLDLVKCNQAEAELSIGRRIDTDNEVAVACRQILESLDARYVVLTRGPAGLSVFEPDREPVHVPAANRTEVFDVTGAGDTVIAVMTLALVAGASLTEAAELASVAAGLVVRRLGVATASPDELLAAIRAWEPLAESR